MVSIDGADHFNVLQAGTEEALYWLRNLSGLRRRQLDGTPAWPEEPGQTQYATPNLEFDAGLTPDASNSDGCKRWGTDFAIQDVAFSASTQNLVLSGHPTGLVSFTLDRMLNGQLEAATMRMDRKTVAGIAIAGDTAYATDGIQVSAWEMPSNTIRMAVPAPKPSTTESADPMPRPHCSLSESHLILNDATQLQILKLADRQWTPSTWDSLHDVVDQAPSIDGNSVFPQLADLRVQAELRGDRLRASLLNSPGVSSVLDRDALAADELPEEYEGLFYVFASGDVGLWRTENHIAVRSLQDGRLLGLEPFRYAFLGRRSLSETESDRLLTLRRDVRTANGSMVRCTTELLAEAKPIAESTTQISMNRRKMRSSRDRRDGSEPWAPLDEPVAFTDTRSGNAIVVTADAILMFDPQKYPTPKCELPQPYFVDYPETVEMKVPENATLISATFRGQPVDATIDSQANRLRWKPHFDQLGSGLLQWHLRTKAGVERQATDGLISLPSIKLPFDQARMRVDPESNRILVWKTDLDQKQTLIEVFDFAGNSRHSFQWPVEAHNLALQDDTLVMQRVVPGATRSDRTTLLQRASLPDSKMDAIQIIAEVTLPDELPDLTKVGKDNLLLSTTRNERPPNPSDDVASPQAYPVEVCYRVTGRELSIDPLRCYRQAGALASEYDRFSIWDGVVWGGNPKQRLLLASFPQRVFSPTSVTRNHLSIGGTETMVPDCGHYPSFLVDDSVEPSAFTHRVAKGMYALTGKSPAKSLSFVPTGADAEPVRLPLSALPLMINPRSRSPQLISIEVAKEHVFICQGNRLAILNRDDFEATATPQNPDLLPVQQTFVLSDRRATKVQYRVRGATTLDLQLFTMNDLERPIFQQQSADGGFAISLRDQIEAIGQSVIQAAGRIGGDSANESASGPHVERWIELQQQSYELVTGKKTKLIPVEIKALVTATSADGNKVGLVHSYLVLISPSWQSKGPIKGVRP